MEKGFTLIELIIVLVLMGVLSTYAVVRFPNQGELVLYSQTELLVTHVRHTQALAVRWREPLRFTRTANGYSVSCVTSSASSPCNSSPVLDPVTGLSFSISAESSVTLSGDTSFDFDSLGRPVASAAVTSSSSQVTLSSGSASQIVTINPITGFASIS